MIWMRGINFIRSLQFYQRQVVGSITIYLVSAGEDEDGFWAMPARRLQQVQCAKRVNVKVHVRIARSPIVRRLGGGVNHDLNISAKRTKQTVDPPVMTDVHVLVPVHLQRLL